MFEANTLDGRLRLTAWVLLIVAASARLLLQMAVMPPNAGLDEAWHAGRIAFVRQAGRNPTASEPSFRGQPNYEAQQPSPYYSLAARLPPGERSWRLFSVLCALISVAATASVAGGRGRPPLHGIAFAALIVSMPTWLTLTVRTSNDALAIALIAAGCALTAAASRPILEGLVWAAALSVKLYAWPLFAAVPVWHHVQKAPRARRAIVLGLAAVSVVLTAIELRHRNGNPVGLFAFNWVPAHPVHIDWFGMVKVFFASLAWTSGQHWNALRPAAVIAYLVGIAVTWGRPLRVAPDKLRACPTLTAAVAFAAAQAVMAWAYIRAADTPMPAGGKEGWYWYTLIPLLALIPPKRILPLAVWLVSWDLLMSEFALFRDYGGLTSPQHGGAIFRWGPSPRPYSLSALEAHALGPLTHYAPWLRAIHLLALIALLCIWRRLSSRSSPAPAA